MNHDGSVLFAVTASVGNVKPLRVVKIHLYGTALPCTLERVLHLYVDLRAVKDTRPGVDAVREPFSIERTFQCIRRTLPVLQRADETFWPGRKIDVVVMKAEGLQDEQGEFEDLQYLILYLVLAAEYMSIVLREASHA